MSRKADAIALTCIDYRFRQAVQDFFDKELNIHAVDHLAMGGGVLKVVQDSPIREWIYDNFDIAFNKHDVNRVILINHWDCGAYGGSAAFAGDEDQMSKQQDQLKQAVSIIGAKYPEKEIEAHLALIDEAGKVSFKKVI